MALPEIISTTELSEVWGVTPQHVHRLAKEGVIPPGKNGKYPCKPTLLAFAKYQRETAVKARGEGGTASKVKDARAREIELRIAEREGELIDVDDAVSALEGVVSAVRSAIDGFPARFTRDMALRRKLEDAANEILGQVAGALAEQASALRAGGRAAPAGEEDDAGGVGQPEPPVSKDRRKARAA